MVISIDMSSHQRVASFPNEMAILGNVNSAIGRIDEQPRF